MFIAKNFYRNISVSSHRKDPIGWREKWRAKKNFGQ
jgi:hypothetical protein